MRRISLVFAPLVLLPGVASAQGWHPRAGAVGLSASHELLGNPLVGGTVGLEYPIAHSRLSFTLGAESVRGSAKRVGVPCAGLIQPGTCFPENIRDDGHVATTSAGVRIREVSWRRLSVDLAGDLRLATVHTETHGLTSGSELSGGKLIMGAFGGVETTVLLSTRIPIALVASANAGGFAPVYTEQVLDGYTPFENAFRASRLEIGFAWSPLRR